MKAAAEDEFRLRKMNADPASEVSVIRVPRTCPLLLVSVRSKDEAERALAGGAEILDVKEPNRGSLGMAAIDDIAAISGLPAVVSALIPLSVALGELANWSQTFNCPALPESVTFTKLGLSQCRHQSNWRDAWLEVRAEFERQSRSQFRWVAVAYADSREAASPDLEDVLHAAIETGCAGLLIDTWTKDGRTLLDETDAASLTVIARECHAAGLFLALAGKLGLDSLRALTGLAADVIAIRSAACRGTERTSHLDSDRVREFHDELRHWCRPTSR
jgi:uncharacterized protein (UPF0264 family)